MHGQRNGPHEKGEKTATTKTPPPPPPPPPRGFEPSSRNRKKRRKGKKESGTKNGGKPSGRKPPSRGGQQFAMMGEPRKGQRKPHGKRTKLLRSRFAGLQRGDDGPLGG